MPEIDVQADSDATFVVTVADGEDRTTHRVTVPAEFAERLVGQRGSTTGLVRLSFEFLLDIFILKIKLNWILLHLFA